MRNVMRTLFVICLLVSTSAFSADGNGEVGSGSTDLLGTEAVSVANLMRMGSVVKCIKELEVDRKAQFSINKITKSEVPDLTKYEITGVLLQGGDMAQGFATLELVGSYQYPWGFAYTCSVKE